MPSPISRAELIKKLRCLGFTGPFSGGKHQFMQRGKYKMFIPNPHGKDIGIIILARIIKELGVSVEKFNSL